MKFNYLKVLLDSSFCLLMFFETMEGSEMKSVFSGDSDPISKDYKVVDCGNYALDSSTSYRFQIPNLTKDKQIPMNYECTWQFSASSGCKPEVTCDDFDLPQVANNGSCSSDFLEISDGSGSLTKFCGNVAPEVVSSASTLIAHFKSGSVDNDRTGFSCSVGCAHTALRRPKRSCNKPPKKPSSDGTSCTCGVPGVPSTSSRIVGGEDAEKYKWKWQAVVQNYGSFICGGSLITDRHVLTAAQCTYGNSASSMSVILNDNNRITPNETITITRNVSSICQHPGYNPRIVDYDVSVLELASPVNVVGPTEPYVTPVCMPPLGTTDTYVSKLGTVTGWGSTSQGGSRPDVLQEVELPVVNSTYCKNAYGTSAITDRMICAGYRAGGKDACQGDSGGPFALRNDTNDGRYLQIGISSWGQGCAQPRFPGVFARLTDTSIMNHILSCTGTTGFCSQ